MKRFESREEYLEALRKCKLELIYGAMFSVAVILMLIAVMLGAC